MGKNVWHIKLRGSTLEREVINVLNFLTDIVFNTIVKPNSEKLEKNVNDTQTLQLESLNNYESLLDTQYELEQAKDDIVDNLEAQLDLEFRVSQIEDTMEV